MARRRDAYARPGAPTTSRFLRTLDSSASSFTTHHYNPYLYTQHKTRPNAPFDVLHIKNKRLVAGPDASEQVFYTQSGLKYTLREGHIPVFRIRKDELPDPVSFYEQVEELGAHFGAVKLVVIQRPVLAGTPGPEQPAAPSSDSPAGHGVHGNSSPASDRVASHLASLSAFSLNTEHFWFKSRRQHLSSFENEAKKRLDFHRALHRFHKHRKDENGAQALGKIPSIDKRSLDLYRLRQCVQLRGGFQTVCRKKLWAQIGRELGYTGRIMSSLSTSLRSAYLKVFCEFNKFEEEQLAKKQVLLAPATPADPETSLLLPSQADNSKKRSLVHLGEEEMQATPAPKKPRCSTPRNYKVGGSCVEFVRLRDVLRFKGFFTNFEHLTESRKNITKPTDSTLPGYQFNFWQNATEIYEKSSHELKNSPIYNLRQYHEKSQKHLESIPTKYQDKYASVFRSNDKTELATFERLFFEIIGDEDFSCDVDTGMNLPSAIHGSGFPTLSKNNEDLASALDPWNLNNVALSPKSLLRYLDTDHGDHTRTRLDVGMLFSVKGWTTEDNFLPCIDYNHLGSSKLWYIVPPEDMGRFEQLLESLEESDIHLEDGNSHKDEDFKTSEFYHCYLDTNPSKPVKTCPPRVNTHTILPSDIIGGLGKAGAKSKCLPNDIQFDPEFLKSQGIKLFKASQDPWSFIIKFPKAYSTTVASGFYVSENVHFAPHTWLNYALESEKWLSTHGILPGIHALQLFVNVILFSRHQELIKKIKSLTSNLVSEEIQGRKFLQNKFGNEYSIEINSFDFISDTSLIPTGFSKVLLTNKTDCVTLSLSEFLEYLVWKDDKAHIFDTCLYENGIHVSLHVCYTDQQLETIFFDKPKTDSVSLNQDQCLKMEEVGASGSISLEELINEKYKGKRVPFDELLTVFSRQGFSDDKEQQNSELRDCLTNISNIRSECKQFIKKLSVSKEELENGQGQFVKGFKIKELAPIPYQCVSQELHDLIQKLHCSSVEFPEMQELFVLWGKFKEFEVEAQMAISTSNILKLRELYKEGWTLGILSKYEEPLRRALHESQWLEVYHEVIEEHKKMSEEEREHYTLDDLPSFLKFGIKYVSGSQHLDKLQKVRNLILECQDMVSRIKKLFKKRTNKIPIEQLENIITTIETKHLPINLEFQKKLKTILEYVEKRKREIAPYSKKLEVNDAYIELLEKQFEFKGVEILNLFDKFDGSPNDLRMTMTEIPDTSLFPKHVKKCKSWLQDMNRLLPRRNQLVKLLESTKTCLDVRADKFNHNEVHDAEARYCFCRKEDSGSAMVECEICREWYHINCINKGKWSLPGKESNVFVCPVCHPQDAFNPPMVEYKDLVELAIASSTLKIIPDRSILQNLFGILRAAITFCDVVQQELFDGNQGCIRPDASMNLVKFYIRKLTGSGCCITDTQEALSAFCRKSDLEKIQRLKDAKTIVITGFENLVSNKVAKSAANVDSVTVKEESQPVTPVSSGATSDAPDKSHLSVNSLAGDAKERDYHT